MGSERYLVKLAFRLFSNNFNSFLLVQTHSPRFSSMSSPTLFADQFSLNIDDLMSLMSESDMPTDLPFTEDSGELLNSLEPLAGIEFTNLAAPRKAARRKVNRTPAALEKRRARDREYAGKRRAATKAATAAAALKFDSLQSEVAALQAENAALRA